MTNFVFKPLFMTLIIGLAAPALMAGCANAATQDSAAESEAVAPTDTDSAAKTATPAIAAAPSVDELLSDKDDGEPRPYDETRNAKDDVNAVLMAAQQSGKHAIIVMGANWCHDSRDLAAHFMTPRFETLLEDNFEYVYVDMGIRNRNLDIAAQFGVKKVEGTPTIIITDSFGKVLNGDTAKSWRDAASRTDDEIYDEFASFAPKAEAPKPEAAPQQP